MTSILCIMSHVHLKLQLYKAAYFSLRIISFKKGSYVCRGQDKLYVLVKDSVKKKKKRKGKKQFYENQQVKAALI